MKLSDINEDAASGTTSIGSGAIAQTPPRAFTKMLKREFIATFLKKRKKNKGKFVTSD